MVGGEKVSCLSLHVRKRKLIQKFDFEYYKVYNRGQMTDERKPNWLVKSIKAREGRLAKAAVENLAGQQEKEKVEAELARKKEALEKAVDQFTTYWQTFQVDSILEDVGKFLGGDKLGKQTYFFNVVDHARYEGGASEKERHHRAKIYYDPDFKRWEYKSLGRIRMYGRFSETGDTLSNLLGSLLRQERDLQFSHIMREIMQIRNYEEDTGWDRRTVSREIPLFVVGIGTQGFYVDSKYLGTPDKIGGLENLRALIDQHLSAK